MKYRIIAGILAVCLLAAAGCSQPQSSPGSEAPVSDSQTAATQPAEDIIEEEEKVMEFRIVDDVPATIGGQRSDVTYGEVVEITYYSKTTGTDRKANVLLPVNYSADKQYPVLYLLHGIGGDHNEWMGGGAANVVYNMTADGLAKDMIVVVPNVRARADDKGNPSDIYTPEHFKAFDNFINDLRDDLMPYMEANYPILLGKENTAIAGLSMGGRESLYIGFSMPETFGYIGAFCPAPGILTYNNHISAEEGIFTEEQFTLPEGSDNFVLIVKGKDDYVVGEAPSSYSEALEKNGVPHAYYETKGAHDFRVWRHGLYNFILNIFGNEQAE